MKNILYDIAVILIAAAGRRETITYNQLSEKLNRQIAPINLGHPIGELSYKSYDLDLPLISVLVVNQDTQIPGDGYFRLSSQLKGFSEIEAMNDFQNEALRVYECGEWAKLLNSLKKDNNDRIQKNIDIIYKPKYWLGVHDQVAYEENSRLLGFKDSVYNAKNIKPKDIVVYYLSGSSRIKGIYEVSETPWLRDPRWSSENQIGIEPIMETEIGVDIRDLVPDLSIFTNKERWFSHIQGTNAVRELSLKDYNLIEKSVSESLIKNNETLYLNLQEDVTGLSNETIEVKINRIKRYQHVINKLKIKYKNECQIEGCSFSFKKKNGDYYSEGHHLELLSEGGSQDEDNVVILCPNHHRMFHYADIDIQEKINNKRKVVINGEEEFIVY